MSKVERDLSNVVQLPVKRRERSPLYTSQGELVSEVTTTLAILRHKQHQEILEIVAMSSVAAQILADPKAPEVDRLEAIRVAAGLDAELDRKLAVFFGKRPA